MKIIIILFLLAIVSGCVTKPKEVVVTYQTGKYGEVYPVVDGTPYPMTDKERQEQIQLLVNEYCTAE